MRRLCFLWILATIAFASCQWGVPHNSKPAITKDTLLYSYKTISEKAANGSRKADSACADAEIKYVVFKNQPKLNDTIVKRLLDAYSVTEKPDGTLQQQAKNFIKAYEDDTTKTSAAAYSLESSAKVIRQDSSLVTVEISIYAYAGGAHGNGEITYINWDTKKNKKISLDDILISGYKKQLTVVAEKIFRAQEKLSDTSSLQDYFFKDQKFALNNNFLITPLGLKFYYNNYEIKPYAAGPTELAIPYTQIKSLLRLNAVLSQYHK